MFHHQSQIAGAASPTSAATAADLSHLKPGKKRGSYNCGRCGLPKKGHSCPLSPSTPAGDGGDGGGGDLATYHPSPSPLPLPPPAPLSRHPYSSHLRRALSFDDVQGRDESPESEKEGQEEEEDPEVGGLPASCMWEVLRRLPPPALLRAAKVCRGWRETARRLWRASEELRVQIPAGAQIGFVGSLLQKCPGLVRLSFRMHRLGSWRHKYSDLWYSLMDQLM